MIRRQLIENAFTASIAAACVAISIADLFGVLGDVLDDRLPTITLLLISAVAIYLVIDRHSRADVDRALHEDTGSIQQALDVVETHVRDANAKSEHIDAFFGAARAGDKLAELKLRYAARMLRNSIDSNTIHVAVDDIHQIWLDCIDGSMKIRAFNYVAGDAAWPTAWSQSVAQNAQAARIAAGGSIGRLFVVDSLSEAKALEPLIEAQRAIGIDARWVLREDIEPMSKVIRFIDQLGTWDLISFDDDLIMRQQLDATRSPEAASVTKDRQLNEKIQFVYDEAYRHSHRDLQDE